MIRLKKSKEPECLSKLKSVGGKIYDDLRGDCDNQVRNLLNTDQKGLCAYCQRTLKIKTFIEHYISQNEDPDKQLDYDNFLGVCSGKYYLDKKNGKAINFCSHSRGSDPLKINPMSESEMLTIYYDDDYRIMSTNPNLQSDLDHVLNLNFDEICLERSFSFDEEFEVVLDMADELGLSQVDAYSRAINSLNSRDPSPEYYGFLIYKFKKGLIYYSSKNK